MHVPSRAKLVAEPMNRDGNKKTDTLFLLEMSLISSARERGEKNQNEKFKGNTKNAIKTNRAQNEILFSALFVTKHSYLPLFSSVAQFSAIIRFVSGELSIDFAQNSIGNRFPCSKSNFYFRFTSVALSFLSAQFYCSPLRPLAIEFDRFINTRMAQVHRTISTKRAVQKTLTEVVRKTKWEFGKLITISIGASYIKWIQQRTDMERMQCTICLLFKYWRCSFWQNENDCMKCQAIGHTLSCVPTPHHDVPFVFVCNPILASRRSVRSITQWSRNCLASSVSCFCAFVIIIVFNIIFVFNFIIALKWMETNGGKMECTLRSVYCKFANCYAIAFR